MDIRYCTVVSNGSLNYVENNTLTQFANVLPFPITPRQTNCLYVRLRTLAMSHKLLNQAATPGHIRVKLKELAPQLTAGRFDRTLALLPFPPGTEYGVYALTDFEWTPFLALETVPLTTLTVSIVNSSGEPLDLAEGPPTIVKLEISEMDYENQFTITAESNASKELFADNTLSEFSNSLPMPLDLTGWEVALQSVAFPFDLVQSSNADVSFTTIIFSNSAPADVKYVVKRMALDPTSTNADLLAAIVTSCNEDDDLKEVMICEVEDETVFYRIRALDNGGNVLRLRFSSDFRRIFDQVPEWIDLASSTYVTLRGEPNVERVQPSPLAYLYTNLIEKNIVASGAYSMLQVVPVQKSTWATGNTTTVYEPQHLIFHPGKQGVQSKVFFYFVDINNTKLNLSSASDQSMIVTVVVRPSQHVSAPRVVPTAPPRAQPGGTRCSLLSSDVCEL